MSRVGQLDTQMYFCKIIARYGTSSLQKDIEYVKELTIKDATPVPFDVRGASRSANPYVIPDGKVIVHFINGSSIIFADVNYTGQTSISQLYATPADAMAHITVTQKCCDDY